MKSDEGGVEMRVEESVEVRGVGYGEHGGGKVGVGEDEILSFWSAVAVVSASKGRPDVCVGIELAASFVPVPLFPLSQRSNPILPVQQPFGEPTIPEEERFSVRHLVGRFELPSEEILDDGGFLESCSDEEEDSHDVTDLMVEEGSSEEVENEELTGGGLIGRLRREEILVGFEVGWRDGGVR